MAREVVDLDAKRAQRAALADADNEPFTIRFGGEDFTAPPLKEWPVAVLDAAQAADFGGAIHELFGDEQWERFKTHRPTLSDVADLFEALGEDAGIGTPGESPPSDAS